MQLSEKLWRKEQYGRLTEKEKRIMKKLDEWSNTAFERVFGEINKFILEDF